MARDQKCGICHKNITKNKYTLSERQISCVFTEKPINTGIAPGAAWLDTLANRDILAPSALMVLAFILSLCSTSDAFIAATLDKFTYGAKLAFLVFGPMLDLKLLFLYQTVLKKKFIVWMAAGLFVMIAAASVYFQWFLNQQIAP